MSKRSTYQTDSGLHPGDGVRTGGFAGGSADGVTDGTVCVTDDSDCLADDTDCVTESETSAGICVSPAPARARSWKSFPNIALSGPEGGGGGGVREDWSAGRRGSGERGG
eukprot:2244348-Rhodomonas_salina.2